MVNLWSEQRAAKYSPLKKNPFREISHFIHSVFLCIASAGPWFITPFCSHVYLPRFCSSEKLVPWLFFSIRNEFHKPTKRVPQTDHSFWVSLLTETSQVKLKFILKEHASTMVIVPISAYRNARIFWQSLQPTHFSSEFYLFADMLRTVFLISALTLDLLWVQCFAACLTIKFWVNLKTAVY